MKPPQHYPRIVTKEQGARCNICLETKELTEDHVPPKSALEHLDVEIEPFEYRLHQERSRLPTSQTGMRFRTICADCNSLLGRDYDPELAQLCSNVRAWLRSPLTLSDRWSVWCNRSALIKSIFGHLLAASAIDPESTPDNEMRDFVLGKRVIPGTSTRVFYWLHPHVTTGVLRGVAMPAVRGRFDSIGIFHFLKVPPIAFLVCDLDEYQGLPRLDAPSTLKADAEVRLWKGLMRDHDWPERVDNQNFIAIGASATDARTAKARMRRRTRSA